MKINYYLQAIDKWLKKKEFKPQRQLTEFLQRRQARIRDRIKETIEEAKRMQQSAKEAAAAEGEVTESTISVEPIQITEVMTITTTEAPETIIEVEEEQEIMIID